MQSDKKKHLAVGAAIALLVWFVLSRFGIFYAPAYGILFSIAAGVLKELWDIEHGGKFDIADAGSTFAGGALAVAGSKFIYTLYLTY